MCALAAGDSSGGGVIVADCFGGAHVTEIDTGDDTDLFTFAVDDWDCDDCDCDNVGGRGAATVTAGGR